MYAVDALTRKVKILHFPDEAVLWQTNPALLNANSNTDGNLNSQKLAADYQNSPLGAILRSANLNNLGGHSDWYIPTYNINDTTEWNEIALQSFDRGYWTSRESLSELNPTLNAIYVNIFNNVIDEAADEAKNSERDVILVRDQIV